MLFDATIPIKPFIMVRHGETESNRANVVAGVVDTPLTDKGRMQAMALRPIVAGLLPRPSVVIRSPLSRTVETAKEMTEGLDLPHKDEPDLIERSFGSWAGQPADDIFDRIRRGDFPPDGDTDEDLMRRVARGLAKVLDGEQEWPLIVAHGGTFDALGWLYGFGVEDIQNAALYAFEPQKNKASPFPWETWQWRFDAKGSPIKERVQILYRSVRADRVKVEARSEPP